MDKISHTFTKKLEKIAENGHSILDLLDVVANFSEEAPEESENEQDDMTVKEAFTILDESSSDDEPPIVTQKTGLTSRKL